MVNVVEVVEEGTAGAAVEEVEGMIGIGVSIAGGHVTLYRHQDAEVTLEIAHSEDPH